MNLTLVEEEIQWESSNLQWESSIALLYVIGLVVVLCDYVETFADEVELVWKAKWRAGKVLFVTIRYSVFPMALLDVANQFCYVSDFTEFTRGHPWHRPCLSGGSMNDYLTWGLFCGIVLTQVLFALRIWAIWFRPRWLSIFLVVLSAITLGAEIYLVAAWNGYVSGPTAAVRLPGETAEYGESAYPQPIAVWIILSVFDGVLMVLTLIKTLEQFRYRSAGTTLMTIVYRDGILYLVAVLATSMAYLGVALVPNGISLLIIADVQYKLYTILACRIMLHIRGTVLRTDIQDSTVVQTTNVLPFRSTTPGSAGSHLQDRGGAAGWFDHCLTTQAAVESPILVIGPE